MTTRTVERVDDWETTPFAGGYEGLRELASAEFSGVVTAGPARLCMLRGTVVGVLDGSIEDFDGADGTARRAPHHALPLLAYMQEVSDEVRAKYYSEDTPLSDVDRTLSEGNFTGYVELAENVLSGDYFQVYHQGRSMSVAFVGSSSRLLTDDEAFETADDEVGIYEVRPVEFEPIEIPGGDAGAGEATDVGTDAAGGTDAGAGANASGDAGPGSHPGSGTASETGSTPGEPGGDRDGANARSDASSGTDAGTEGADAGSAPSGDRGDRAERTADAGRASDDRDDRSNRSESRGNGRSGGSDGDRGATGGSGAADGTHGTESDRGANAGRSAGDDAAGGSSAGERRGAGEASSDAGAETHAGSAGDTPATAGADRSTGSERAAGVDAPDRSDGEPATGSDESDAGDSVADAAGDLETRSIPSLDPARSRSSAGSGGDLPGAGGPPPGSKTAAGGAGPGGAGGDAPGAGAAASEPATGADAPGDGGTARREASSESGGTGGDAPRSGQADAEPAPSEAGGRSEPAEDAGADRTESGGADSSAAGSAAGGGRVREQLDDREAEVRELERELQDLTEERDDLAAERDRLQSELEDARAEIERLETRLAEADEAGGSPGGTQLTADRAVDETNLFVRYDSKGEATLEKAHGGTVDRAAVAENLRLEYHTQFDAADATVAGEPFDDFLSGTIQYRFVEWLVTSLLWEIRDTGHVDGMKDLYDALPKIDRAELNGQVSVQFEEEGEEHRTQESFDVVVRDRMGNPLVVANINDSRDPATDSMMTDLVKTSQRVGESSGSLAGAVLVTKSFFQPEALETAEEAASSGLFSRDKRASFVNLSRKDGFHLCLVEARNDEIHLTVPEL